MLRHLVEVELWRCSFEDYKPKVLLVMNKIPALHCFKGNQNDELKMGQVAVLCRRL